MSFTTHCNEIFNQAIRDYHITDNVDTPISNPSDLTLMTEILSKTVSI